MLGDSKTVNHHLVLINLKSNYTINKLKQLNSIFVETK